MPFGNFHSSLFTLKVIVQERGDIAAVKLYGQLYCNSKNEFELSVRGLDASVIVGDTCDAADKLKRLEVFVKQRINNFETQTLKNINLNYKNQIVCTKR